MDGLSPLTFLAEVKCFGWMKSISSEEMGFIVFRKQALENYGAGDHFGKRVDALGRGSSKTHRAGHGEEDPYPYSMT